MSDVTPNPWEAREYAGAIYVYPTGNPDAAPIAMVATDLAAGTATARLIAAAPDLLALLRAYERWEADLILCDAAWRDRAFPALTAELYDRLMELQTRRNAIFAKVKGG